MMGGPQTQPTLVAGLCVNAVVDMIDHSIAMQAITRFVAHASAPDVGVIMRR